MKSNMRGGFTLIEVLIALIIISIAMTAIIKNTIEDTEASTYLQDKMIATWVAQQILNEARLKLRGTSDMNDLLVHKMTMLGKKWIWQLEETSTANPRINKISVSVAKDNDEDELKNKLIELESYVYHGQS